MYTYHVIVIQRVKIWRSAGLKKIQIELKYFFLKLPRVHMNKRFLMMARNEYLNEKLTPPNSTNLAVG